MELNLPAVIATESIGKWKGEWGEGRIYREEEKESASAGASASEYVV